MFGYFISLTLLSMSNKGISSMYNLTGVRYVSPDLGVPCLLVNLSIANYDSKLTGLIFIGYLCWSISILMITWRPWNFAEWEKSWRMTHHFLRRCLLCTDSSNVKHNMPCTIYKTCKVNIEIKCFNQMIFNSKFSSSNQINNECMYVN